MSLYSGEESYCSLPAYASMIILMYDYTKSVIVERALSFWHKKWLLYYYLIKYILWFNMEINFTCHEDCWFNNETTASSFMRCMLEGGIPNSATHYRLLYSHNPETHLHLWYFPAGIPQYVMLLHYILFSSSVSLLELLCCNINYNFKNTGTTYADVYTQYS
jgi:hypothetical protein